MQSKKRKIASAVGAGVLAIAIALTGTYAWQSISQKALNETEGNINPGGRLHDDFDGRNKDIYVENFTDPEKGGVPIFIRVRLDEYMEIGPDAGKKDKTEEEKLETKSVVPNAKIDDVTTWTPHKPAADGTADTCGSGSDEDAIHNYWGWDLGGKTVYMPTFNKNKDSLKADINGTMAGVDGDPATGDPYDDYVEYTAGQKVTGNAVYDADDNDVDEGDAAVENTNITTVEEEHTAKETQQAEAMTMAQWIERGSPLGKFWVYDVDGWAYWAEGLMPGEATGLLLDGINLNMDPDNNWYYGINVVGQFATRGDWGDPVKGTGFYDASQGTAPTDDALFLLKQAADLLPAVTKISIKQGSQVYVKAGESITLEEYVSLKNGTGTAAESAVEWKIEPAAGEAFADGTLNTTSDMAEKTYRVTVTSVYDKTFSASTNVYVYPADADGVVTGEDTLKYVKYTDNTYRAIGADGKLGAFICAGSDRKIGNTDDSAKVVAVDVPHETYGSKFIGPDEDDEGYWSVGPDGLLGTEDDVKVWGNPATGDLSPTQPIKADKVTVTAAGSAITVKPGTTLQFSASVTLNNTAIENQNVTWSLSGATQAGTTIDSSGLLTVAANEPDATALTVKATSKAAPSVSGEAKVTVKVSNIPAELEEIDKITPGTTTTVKIDGIDWYVLAKEGDKALLWSKEMVPTWGSGGKGAFSASSNSWQTSTARSWLNSTFLDSLTTLKDSVADTKLNTRTQYNASTWVETTDKVFLLSEADCFGQHNGSATSEAKDYTYNGTKLVTNASLLSCSNSITTYSWLRSPRGSTGGVAVLGYTGSVYNHDYNYTTYGVRPALWVNLAS